jgi:hypothetical protein
MMPTQTPCQPLSLSEAATSLPPPPSEEANANAEQHYGPWAEFTHVNTAKGKLLMCDNRTEKDTNQGVKSTKTNLTLCER